MCHCGLLVHSIHPFGVTTHSLTEPPEHTHESLRHNRSSSAYIYIHRHICTGTYVWAYMHIYIHMGPRLGRRLLSLGGHTSFYQVTEQVPGADSWPVKVTVWACQACSRPAQCHPWAEPSIVHPALSKAGQFADCRPRGYASGPSVQPSRCPSPKAPYCCSTTRFQQWRMPVPIVSSSTPVASAHRVLSATTTSSGPSSTWKLWTCIVNFKCEKTQGTLPRSPTCLMLAFPCPSLEPNIPATNSCAVRLRLAAVQLVPGPGRIWLGSSHNPARSPVEMPSQLVSRCCVSPADGSPFSGRF